MSYADINEFVHLCELVTSQAKSIGFPSSVFQNIIMPHINNILKFADTNLIINIVDSLSISNETKNSFHYILNFIQFVIEYKNGATLKDAYNNTFGKLECPSFFNALNGFGTMFREVNIFENTDHSLDYYLPKLEILCDVKRR